MCWAACLASGLLGRVWDHFEGFFNSSYYGRLTLFDWLGISAGVVVLLLTLMALAMFYFAEIAEAYFGESRKPISWRPHDRIKMSAAASLLAACGLLIVLGQPTPQAKWDRLKGAMGQKLEDREIYVHPGEVVELKKDPSLFVRILDVRPEADFNLFHIGGAQRLDLAEISKPLRETSFVGSRTTRSSFWFPNGEQASTQAWQALKAGGVLNLYVIEGGINKWLEVFPPEPCLLANPPATAEGSGQIGWRSHRPAVASDLRSCGMTSAMPWGPKVARLIPIRSAPCLG